MKETSKATKRRASDTSFPWREIIKGDICDVGPEDDPLIPFDDFISTVTLVQLPDGGGDDLTKFVSQKFGCIHGSQVVEHAISPITMLNSWLACLKPTGYIVFTVPHWTIYEKETWPSMYNAGHRTAWEIFVEQMTPEQVRNIAKFQTRLYSERKAEDFKSDVPLIKLPYLLSQIQGDVKLCRLVDTNYDYDAPIELDQTFDFEKGVEAFVECVIQTRP